MGCAAEAVTAAEAAHQHSGLAAAAPCQGCDHLITVALHGAQAEAGDEVLPGHHTDGEGAQCLAQGRTGQAA